MVMVRNIRTGGEPVVLHATGTNGRSGAWALLKDEVLRIMSAEPPQAVPLDCTYALLTWSSVAWPTCLERCCEAIGVEPVVMRVPDPDVWQNILKIELTLEFLSGCTADYVIGLDAFDVLLLAHPSEVVRRYREAFEPAGTRLLFNAACRAWPGPGKGPTDACLSFELQTFPARDRHLNAGAWVGRTSYVATFWRSVADLVASEKWPREYRHSEQIPVRAAAFPGHYPALSLDTGCSIFQHMEGGKKDLMALDGRITSGIVRH